MSRLAGWLTCTFVPPPTSEGLTGYLMHPLGSLSWSPQCEALYEPPKKAMGDICRQEPRGGLSNNCPLALHRTL